MVRMVGWLVLGVAVGTMAYVRFAPTEPLRWHQPIASGADTDMANGAVRVVPAGEDALARLDEIAMATPRTDRLAGSVADGRVTYETRSRIMGFPDYTTVEFRDGALRLFGRSRFGRNDFGVNRARLEAWLSQL